MNLRTSLKKLFKKGNINKAKRGVAEPLSRHINGELNLQSQTKAKILYYNNNNNNNEAIKNF